MTTSTSHTAQGHAAMVTLVLAMGAFAIGTSEFSAMGLLPFFTDDLGMTVPEGGNVISAYALGVVIGAPLTTVLGARLARRRYLVMLLWFYALTHILTAVVPGAFELVAIRFFAGLPHGGYLGVGMLAAADLLPRKQRARGMAHVLMGLTVANIAGVPLAGWIGQTFGWRIGFVIPGVLAAVTAVALRVVMPQGQPNRDAHPITELKGLTNPAVLSILAIAAIGCGGMFAVYAYLPAALRDTTDAPSWVLPTLLASFGVGMTLSNWLGGRVVERLGTVRTALMFFATAAVVQVVASLAIGSWPAMVVAAFLLALGSAGLVIPLQAALTDVAGDAQNMAAAMNHAAFNAANALGPALAGIALTAGFGWRSSGIVGVVLAGVGALILVVTRRLLSTPTAGTA